MPEKQQTSDRSIWVNEPEFYEDKYWLHPVAGRFLETAENLNYEYPNQGILETMVSDFKRSFIDWVSSGLIAKWITRKRVWQQQYKSWRDFCIEGLGKMPGTVKRLINNAEVVQQLAEYGFSILPTNQSQVEKLVACTKKLDCLIEEAWDKVVTSLPEPLITADAIAEVLGFAAKKKRIIIDRELADRLRAEAVNRGVNSSELHQQIIDDWLNQQDEVETEAVEPEAMAAWQADVEELVREHDNQNWLWCVVIKMTSLIQTKLNFGKGASPESNSGACAARWLEDYRVECQT